MKFLDPVTELSTESESLSSEEISLTTESVKDSNDEIETIFEPEVTTTAEEEVPTEDCSHCLQRKYLNHYSAKGCTPILDENCKECPKSFDCSEKEEKVVENDG